MSGVGQNVVDSTLGLVARDGQPHNLLARVSIKAHIKTLQERQSWEKSDCLAVEESMFALRYFMVERVHREIIVKEGGIDALIPHLCAPLVKEGGGAIGDLWKLLIERGALSLLVHIAKEKEESYRLAIVDAGILPHLAALLLQKVMTSNDNNATEGNLIIEGHFVIERTILLIKILSQGNEQIQARMGKAGVISSLLVHLKSTETKVQKEALAALGMLASNNAVNRNFIIDHTQNLCPTLLFMLQSDNDDISKVAIEAVRNFVKGTSVSRKRRLLRAGVLEPVICLLSLSCQYVQKHAMTVLHDFAVVESFKVPIVHQYGAVGHLLNKLKCADAMNQAKALVILRELASKPSNQARILTDGGLDPLLDLLESTDGRVQAAAVAALFVFSEHKKNVFRIIQGGGVQLLHDVDFTSPQATICAHGAFEMLKKNTNDRMLERLLRLLRRSTDKGLQGTVACALAYLCSPNNLRRMFVVHRGLEVLLEMLSCTFKSSRQQLHGARALYKLATMKPASSIIYAVNPPMIPPAVYLGEEKLNSKTSSDVTFMVEGIPFYAHKSVLCASSDTFRAMLEGGYKEQDLSEIPIIHISWNVFALMMRHIYTGTVEVTIDEAQDLFQAADQYLLESLKRLCEGIISRGLKVENAAKVYGLAKAHQTLSLQRSCVLFVLKEHEQICSLAGYPKMIEMLIPGICEYILHILS